MILPREQCCKCDRPKMQPIALGTVRRISTLKDSKKSPVNARLAIKCSFANSGWRKRTPEVLACTIRCCTSFYKFNDLHAGAGLARQMPLLMVEINGATCRDFKNLLDVVKSGVYMFDGKNNRILDSLSFRLALTAAVFAVWYCAGYLLLSL